MALNPIITSLSFNSDATEGTITDTTVYGGAEFDRNEVAVYLQLWKMDEDEEETVQTIDNDEPDTNTTWVFDSETDGWYRALITIIPNWVSGNYAAGNVVYYNGDLYESILLGVGNPVPTNPTYFSPIDFDDEDILEGDNITYEYQDYLVIEQGKICAGTAAADWYKEQDCSNCKKTDFASSMFKKRALVIAAQRFAALNLYSKAEEVARKLEILCESC